MDIYEQEIASRIAAGQTYRQISRALQQRINSSLGFSPRNIRRFCAERGIHYRCGFTDQQLDRLVASLIQSVGHSYGRRTMHGLLRALGIHVSQRRVGASMGRVAPRAQRGRRQQVHRHLNPPPYTALFYGDKVHFDQNEKMAMYGVTHVVAIDGFSRKIVGMITIPIKNPITIYNTLMKPLMEVEGLWQQVRIDHGTEFCLISTVQQHLAGLRCWQTRHPVLQSTSRQNHRVERIWPEVNQRINYPVKRVLVEMEGNEEINMMNEVDKFCVSWITINVVRPAIMNFILAWNSHRIPGTRGGIPNVLASSASQTTRLSSANIPSTAQVIQLHRNQGGHLGDEHTYGRDPLEGYEQLQQLRERDFWQMYPNMEEVFQNVVTGNASLFKQAIKSFIRSTKLFAELI